MNEENKDKNINQDDLEKLAKFMESLYGKDSLDQFSLENFNIEKITKVLRTKEQFEHFSESLKYSIREIWKLLPSISALSAMLLIVATFNHELIPINFSVKLLLSTFLALIPLGIWGAFIDLTKVVDSSLKEITKVVKEGTGKDIDDQIKKAKKLTILGILPFVVVFIFSLAILVIIFLIWKIDLVGLLIKII